MKHTSHLIHLNISVFLISTSGLFGRLIQLSPELTILYRCIVAGLLLYTYLRWSNYRPFGQKLAFKTYLFLGGLLMAVHWVSYFYALSLSSIAIAMLTLHTHPVMTAILEPVILKTKFQNYHIALALLVLLGIWFILPSFDFKDKIVLAVICGLLSALSFSLRNIWTRKIMTHYNASQIMFYNLVIMTVLLLPFLFTHNPQHLKTDWPYILALAILTTAIGHTMFVNALKHFSAVSVSLISSIIPIYGILWGMILLNEIPGLKTVIGGILILSTFIIESLYSHKKLKHVRK